MSTMRRVDDLGRGYGTGRAKHEAVARVWVKATEAKNANGVDIIVNDRDAKDYFCRDSLMSTVAKPVTVLREKYTDLSVQIKCTVAGGGLSGQAAALVVGICKGLVELNPEFKKMLKDAGLLTIKPGKKRKLYAHYGHRAGLTYKRR